MRGVSGATTSGREAKRSDDENRDGRTNRHLHCQIASVRRPERFRENASLVRSSLRPTKVTALHARNDAMLANLGKRSRSGRRKGPKVRRARTGGPTEGTCARSARGRGLQSTGGSDPRARSAGAEHLRAWEGAKQVQGVRGREHLRAREAAKHVQGVRGGSICDHGRQRYRCKECGGSGICEHGRQRSLCKECGGASICEHGRVRSRCKECGGSQICEHGRVRTQCKECGALRSASTGGSEARARSAGEGASAITGGGEASARSAGLEHLRAREAAKQPQGVRPLIPYPRSRRQAPARG